MNDSMSLFVDLLLDGPLFVEGVAPLLAEHAGVELADVNALHGSALVDGMRVTVSTSLAALRDEKVLEWARQNATLSAVQDGYEASSSSLRVVVDGITDPFAGLALVCRVADVLARLRGVSVVIAPWQELVTTPQLWLGDRQMAGEASVASWFSTLAMWVDDARSTSMAVTRGLWVVGAPEVFLPAAPWEPARTRDVVRSVVGSLLAQRVPAQPGVGFSLGDLPVELVESQDPLTGDPALAIVPSTSSV